MLKRPGVARVVWPARRRRRSLPSPPAGHGARDAAGPAPRRRVRPTSAADLVGIEPPLGPTTSTHSPPGGAGSRAGSSPSGSATTSAGRLRSSITGRTPSISGNRGRRHCVAASSAIRRRPGDAACSRRLVQGGTDRRVDSKVTPSTPSSVSFWTARSGFVPLVSDACDGEARVERGSTTGAMGVQVDGSRAHAHDRVGAPTPVAVGGGHGFAPAETPHPAR